MPLKTLFTECSFKLTAGQWINELRYSLSCIYTNIIYKKKLSSVFSEIPEAWQVLRAKHAENYTFAYDDAKPSTSGWRYLSSFWVSIISYGAV